MGIGLTWGGVFSVPVAAVLGISGEERRNVLAGACGAGWALPLFGVLSFVGM